MAAHLEPLPAGKIRLLHLHPGSGTEPLRCSIVQVELDLSPSYEAMSYQWGDANEREEIICDGQPIGITASGGMALRRFRDESQTRVLWMDQICIDQTNLQERSQQVGVMWKIFSNATRVLMWLGPDPDGLAFIAKDFVEQLQSRYETPAVFKTTYEETCLKENLPSPDSISWKAYKTLMALPYFTRVWMLQEVLLATNSVAFWGQAEIPFAHIAKAAIWGQESSGLHGQGHEGQGHVDEEDCIMVRQMFDRGGDDSRELSWMIGLLSYRQATDARDKIFAIMNLVDPGERPNFVADYTLATVDVYKMTAEHIIFNIENSLDVLQNCSLTMYHPLHYGERWPSWIPRWGDIKHAYICGVETGNFLPGDGALLDAYIGSDKDMLCARGVAVGSIHAQGKAYYIKDDTDITMIDHCWDLTKKYADPTLSDEPLVLQLLWSLLCVEADAHLPDVQAILRHELGWCFIDYYYFLLRLHDIVRTEYDIMDAVVLALLGRLKGIFDRSNPAHALLAREWKEEIRQRGFDAYVYRSCVQDIHNPNDGSKLDQDAVEAFACYMMACLEHNNPRTFDGSDAAHFQDAILQCGDHHRFFVTESGRVGMSPREAQEGDVVAILFGSSVPFLLRPIDGHFLVVGSCYCYGIMHGELVQQLKRNNELDSKTQIFTLR